MKHTFIRVNRSRGFTLIELIVAMVVFGIATVGIIKLQGRIIFGQAENIDMVTGTQTLQGCAETIVATRRRLGFSAVNAGLCPSAVFPGVSVTLKPMDSSTPARCATTSDYCDVTITKTGATLNSSILLRLYKY